MFSPWTTLSGKISRLDEFENCKQEGPYYVLNVGTQLETY